MVERVVPHPVDGCDRRVLSILRLATIPHFWMISNGMVSKQLELRDAFEMGEIGIIKELSQLLSKGALRMECYPSMVSNMV